MTMIAYLLLASMLPSTTYGYGELMCGNVGQPQACAKGALTASGAEFDPSIPQVALALPARMRMAAKRIRLRLPGGRCQWVGLVDKMNERYIGQRGFDLNPAALALLTRVAPNKTWSGRVELCT